ncbi:MAG: type 4a pilus biogenesis protein PilO [Candidatus Pacebacteria bacterium]|nr:type 4a pilus biogenesis protein PilO [Candidatus Paceibacterota bacterium]
MMNKIKKKIYIKAVLLLTVVLILFCGSFFHLPQKIEGLSLEIINKKKQIKQLNAQNDQIENIRDKHDELQKNVGNVSEYIIDYSSIFNFVTEIKSVAEKNNVDLGINVSNEGKMQATEFLSYINYNVKATGKFDDIMHFLSYLENLKYYIDIEKMKISRNNDNEVVLDSVLKVYVRDNK